MGEGLKRVAKLCGGISTIEKSSGNKRSFPPPADNKLNNVVESVVISEDERVEWIYTHTPEGRYVSGYNIKSNNE